MRMCGLCYGTRVQHLSMSVFKEQTTSLQDLLPALQAQRRADRKALRAKEGCTAAAL